MTKLIQLADVRNQQKLQKRLLKVEFQKRNQQNLQEELYIENNTDDNEIVNISVENLNADLRMTAKLSEDPFDGGYRLKIGNKDMFLNYAEILDMYVLLTALYSRNDGINNISSILD